MQDAGSREQGKEDRYLCTQHPQSRILKKRTRLALRGRQPGSQFGEDCCALLHGVIRP
jgi:hypothetical protein